MDHSGKALSEVSKELVEIAVCGDCLCDLQQTLVPLRQRLTGG